MTDRIKALAQRLADKHADPLNDSEYDGPSEQTIAYLAFLKGADALAEVYRIEGRISGLWDAHAIVLRKSPDEASIEHLIKKAEAQLEALINELEKI